MSWVPVPQVTIGGVDVSDVTIQQASLRRGRDRVYQEPSAGYATVRLLAPASFAVPSLGTELGVLIDPGVIVDATGGNEVFDATTRDGTFQVHRFTSVGTATFTLGEPAVVDLLVVGGGGDGLDGGGGAGGLLLKSTLLAAGAYTVVVGAGGTTFSAAGASSFDSFVAPAGGIGQANTLSGLSGAGGSGGGGSSRFGRVNALPGIGTIPFGNSGGAAFGSPNTFDNSGGGGGFREAGQPATSVVGGDGGRGIILDFDGVVRDYASGGGGRTSFQAAVDGPNSSGGGPSGGDGGYSGASVRLGTAGQANTGGGGGTSAAGGSGVVIVRVPRKLASFRGSISDVSVEAVTTANGLLFAYDVTAVGPIALLSRQRVFVDGRPVELDGARISDAITNALGVRWEEFPDSTWGDVAAETTWLNIDPVFSLANIDRGAFDLAVLGAEPDGVNALSVVNESALSGRGVLFETAGGVLGYADRRRRIREADSTPVVLSFNDVEVNSFSTASSVGDVTNVADVEWADGLVSAKNAAGIQALFRLERKFRTVLNVEADAQAFADELVETQGVSRFRIQRVQVNLLGLSSAEARAELVRLPIGRFLRVTDVPSPIGSGTFDGFIEGVELSVGTFEARLTMLVSDLRFSVPEFTPVVATGGDAVFDWIREDNGVLSRAHVFLSNDTLVVTGGGDVEFVLLGGGGGGGGNGVSGGPGGGGAGGLFTGGLTLAAGSFPMTVGAGGSGASRLDAFAGNDGGQSTAFGLTALGGGGGGASATFQDGRAGGSGGGAGANSSTAGVAGAGTAGQGFAGGAGLSGASARGGGGGGAAGVGGAAGGAPGVGGAGGLIPLLPFAWIVATGGSGSDVASTLTRSGIPESGEGGQGSSQTVNGGSGGSGVVVVVYPLEPA